MEHVSWITGYIVHCHCMIWRLLISILILYVQCILSVLYLLRLNGNGRFGLSIYFLGFCCHIPSMQDEGVVGAKGAT